MTRLIAALSRVGGYAARDPRLTAEALTCRLVLPALKRTVSIAALARLMWSAPREERSLQQHERVERLRDFAVNGGRVLVSTNCLERSLFLYRQLSRMGAAPTLVLGASPTTATVAGHAWVEVDAVPFADTECAAYVPVVMFSGEGAHKAAGVGVRA